ncbi:hypothetical protein KIL84_011284 [Mauremys mutica]|uniref:Uncharacterized protein n=1 Tax=Mauremys mutica TaxID=74926 RepID=A0A9D4AV76_9SAUR|nr:hypothetical protein KIL84_011284 [Mauremys mutica]
MGGLLLQLGRRLRVGPSGLFAGGGAWPCCVQGQAWPLPPAWAWSSPWGVSANPALPAGAWNAWSVWPGAWGALPRAAPGPVSAGIARCARCWAWGPFTHRAGAVYATVSPPEAGPG